MSAQDLSRKFARSGIKKKKLSLVKDSGKWSEEDKERRFKQAQMELLKATAENRRVSPAHYHISHPAFT